MKRLSLWLLVSVSVCCGATRFVLDAELRTDFADNGSSTQFITGYTYDASGNRVQSRVWSGADTTTVPMSAVKFIYNAGGAVTEALQLSGADTSAIVRYSYVGSKLIAVRTLRKDGTVRFTDSLLYDAQGRNVEEQRIVSTGVKSYYHRYTFNVQGKMVADTMFELVNAAYVASQAAVFTYNTDATVASEAQWHLSGTSWYCISTAFMRYAAGTLVSVATHERDGVGTGMTDSLAYTYDASGNRTTEEKYDRTGTMIHRIMYTWRGMQPSFVFMNEKARSNGRSAMSIKQGRLTAELSSQPGTITIYDMVGKLVCRIVVDHSGIVRSTGLSGNGSYIAVFSTGGINKQTMAFTHLN